MSHEAHFLVPVKLESGGCLSLTLAVEMAREAGGRVTLLHVDERTWPRYRDLDALGYLNAVLHQSENRAVPIPTFGGHHDCQARMRLDGLLERIPLDQRRSSSLRAVFRQGDPTTEILKMAAEEKIGTIVLDVRPRRWWWSRRHVMEGVLRGAPCRVVLVQPPVEMVEAAVPRWASAFSPMAAQ